MTIRTNLVKNPSFEVDTTGWAGTTLSRVTSESYVGAASLSSVNGANGRIMVYGATTGAVANADSIPVTVGQQVRLSLYAKVISGGTANVYAKIHWFNAAGSWISDTDGTSTALTTSWQRLSVTGTAPTNATKFGVVLFNGGTFTTIYSDGWLVEYGSTLGTYFDGSTVAGGVTYAWTGTAHASTSTATPTGAYVKDVYNSPSNVTTANPTIAVTAPIETGDVLVLMSAGASSGITAQISAVSGCGATWTKNTAATDAGVILETWVGTGATSTGTITMTSAADANGRTTTVWHASGTTATLVGGSANGSTATTTAQNAAQGQIVFASTYTATSASAAFSSPTPSTDWVQQAVKTTVSGARWTAAVHRVPTGAAESHSVTTTSTGTAYASQLLLGDPVAGGQSITSALSGSATLTTVLQRRIASNFTGSATLTTVLKRNIASNFSGSATLTTDLVAQINSQLSGSVTLTSTLGRFIPSNLSAAVTLTSTLHRYIQSDFSASAALTSSLTGYQHIQSSFSGSATLTTVLVTSGPVIESNFSGRATLTTTLDHDVRQLDSHFGAEVVLYSELEYIISPQPLADTPLGKLVRYTVNNSAVPVNPAEGSGSTPSVNATYIKGKNPEFALGENFTVDNGAVGTYTGEIVRLALSKKSDVATISTDTLLTLANVEMHLFPFIDAAPSTWTAARAIDYWTQQTGLFYDKVDGDCRVYASGFGHPNGYAEGAGNSHFYDKLTAGTVSTSVVNERSVTSFGSAATAVMAQYEAPQTRVPVTVGSARKLIFSLGLGLRGTGRAATASYRFLDGLDNLYTVDLVATSAGTVTASINGAVASSITVPAGGDYRVSFSLQRMSETALVVKLTAHEDDLAGNGDLIVNGPAKVFSAAVPATLWLTSLVHSSAGGSGAEMLRWGTYLSVAKFHPMTLPRVQKTLAQSKKALGYVSGFSANVWAMLNEFCSINRLDLSFVEDRVVMGPRADGFNGSVKFSDFEVVSERREKYRQVAVVNKQSKAVTDNTAVLWRADSVFQVAAREVFETTVQTGHSILNVANPVAVTGIWPFPYTAGAGQYVVTGADGYIVAPAWWNDNGGKVEVSLTEKDGEIAIKITAPSIDTVRAPYRISEGEGDRPALYISGSGIVNDPEELHINTGAKKAREGFDNVFESPFIATSNDAFNTAARMAQVYSAAAADVSFTTPNEFDSPSVLGTYPSGVVFTDNERNFKITDASQTHSEVSGNAIPFTTLAAYKASFPAGSTIADEKVRHYARTIKQANIKPLRSNSDAA